MHGVDRPLRAERTGHPTLTLHFHSLHAALSTLLPKVGRPDVVAASDLAGRAGAAARPHSVSQSHSRRNRQPRAVFSRADCQCAGDTCERVVMSSHACTFSLPPSRPPWHRFGQPSGPSPCPFNVSLLEHHRAVPSLRRRAIPGGLNQRTCSNHTEIGGSFPQHDHVLVGACSGASPRL